MAYFPARVKVDSISTGTGLFDVSGTPATGFRIFADVPWPDTEGIYPVPYAIVAVDGSGVPTGQWETGNGDYDCGADHLLRTSPLEGSSGDETLVNFSAGTKQVFITPSREFLEQATLGSTYAMARGFAMP